MVSFLGFLAVAGLGIFGGGTNAATVDNNQTTIIESSVDVDSDYMIIKKTYRVPVAQVQKINGSAHLLHVSFSSSLKGNNEFVSTQIVDPRYFDCDAMIDKGTYREKCVERDSPKSESEARAESLKTIGTIISPIRPAVKN